MIKEFYKLVNVNHKFSTPYHLQINNVVEKSKWDTDKYSLKTYIKVFKILRYLYTYSINDMLTEPKSMRH